MLLSSTSIFSQVLNEMECSIYILCDTTIALHRKKFFIIVYKLTNLFFDIPYTVFAHSNMQQYLYLCVFAYFLLHLGGQNS